MASGSPLSRTDAPPTARTVGGRELGANGRETPAVHESTLANSTRGEFLPGPYSEFGASDVAGYFHDVHRGGLKKPRTPQTCELPQEPVCPQFMGNLPDDAPDMERSGWGTEAPSLVTDASESKLVCDAGRIVGGTSAGGRIAPALVRSGLVADWRGT